MNTSVLPLPTNSNTGPKSGLAVTSLVLGICSVTLCGLFTGLPAIITGHIAHGRARRSPGQFGGGGMAIAGFVMGYVSVFITLVVLPALLLPALSKAKEKAQRIHCASNLKLIATGSRIWAEDHDDRFPADFASLKAELGIPRILVCPADGTRKPATDWNSWEPRNVTYQIITPGAAGSEHTKVFARCPIHGTEVYVDGSVHQRPMPSGR